jgi:hypothetical protein
MAKDKASFVLYCDLIHTVEHLTDLQAGKLFKLILQYVNDKNPDNSKDTVLKIAFEPIKRQLKRDLKEWEAERSKRSVAGKMGGIKSGESRRKRSKRSSASKNEANEADNVTVTVNVTDTVNENVIIWDNVKQNFFNDFRWKEKFCRDKGIIMIILEEKMNEFISDTELKEDYKPLPELKNHFTNLFNKNKNGFKNNSGGGKHTGAMQLLDSLKKDFAGGK